MKLRTIPYHRYERGLPQSGHFILGQIRDQSIIVYQAFHPKIATYAVANQCFGGAAYRFSRMTWIKPNFLWMMYRSGWATKVNQERILAIQISLDGFYELLRAGVYSSFQAAHFETQEQWKAALASSDVRIQWDPDHDPKGEKLSRRAIQIGIRGKTLEKFNQEYIEEITDITDFVHTQRAQIEVKESLFVMDESIIEMDSALKQKYAIPEHFIAPSIQELLEAFMSEGEISEEAFEKLLLEGVWRNDWIDYIKNYQHRHLSRYLLRKAIAARKSGKEILCEDLLLFSFFVSKNKTTKDLDLIMKAKLTDFDTWAGFDGEMVFYPLGYEPTLSYLQANKEKFGEKAVDYFSTAFSKEYLYQEIKSRAFWYFY